MRQTDHPRFMGDVWNAHDLQLTYTMYMSNGRHTECSHFMVDFTDKNYLSAIGIHFPTPSPTT